MSDNEEPTAEDALGTGMTMWDILDLSQKLLHGGKAGGLDQPLATTISSALDMVSVARGGFDLIQGGVSDDPEQMVKGGGELLDGGTGIAATLLGNSTAGALMGAFSAGYGAGDLIAPYVFPEVGKGPADGLQPDGKYHPSSGNETFDDIIQWFVPDNP